MPPAAPKNVKQIIREKQLQTIKAVIPAKAGTE